MSHASVSKTRHGKAADSRNILAKLQQQLAQFGWYVLVKCALEIVSAGPFFISLALPVYNRTLNRILIWWPTGVLVVDFVWIFFKKNSFLALNLKSIFPNDSPLVSCCDPIWRLVIDVSSIGASLGIQGHGSIVQYGPDVEEKEIKIKNGKKNFLLSWRRTSVCPNSLFR